MIPRPDCALSINGIKSLSRIPATSPKWQTSYMICCITRLRHSGSAIPNLCLLLSSVYLSYNETTLAQVSTAMIEQTAALAPMHGALPCNDVKILSKAKVCNFSALLPKKSPRIPQDCGDGKILSHFVWWKM